MSTNPLDEIAQAAKTPRPRPTAPEPPEVVKIEIVNLQRDIAWGIVKGVIILVLIAILLWILFWLATFIILAGYALIERFSQGN